MGPLDVALVECVFETLVPSSARANRYALEPEPGYHVALCFIPGAGSGAPHGMPSMSETW